METVSPLSQRWLLLVREVTQFTETLFHYYMKFQMDLKSLELSLFCCLTVSNALSFPFTAVHWISERFLKCMHFIVKWSEVSWRLFYLFILYVMSSSFTSQYMKSNDIARIFSVNLLGSIMFMQVVTLLLLMHVCTLLSLKWQFVNCTDIILAVVCLM